MLFLNERRQRNKTSAETQVPLRSLRGKQAGVWEKVKEKQISWIHGGSWRSGRREAVYWGQRREVGRGQVRGGSCQGRSAQMWGAEHWRSCGNHLLVVPLTIHNTHKADQTWTSVGVEFWKERLETTWAREERCWLSGQEQAQVMFQFSNELALLGLLAVKPRKQIICGSFLARRESVKRTCSINCTLSFTFPLPMAPLGPLPSPHFTTQWHEILAETTWATTETNTKPQHHCSLSINAWAKNCLYFPFCNVLYVSISPLKQRG